MSIGPIRVTGSAPGARLPNLARWCKTLLVVSLLLPLHLSVASAGVLADLRDCVADAHDAAAVEACEATQREALKARIERWSAGILGRLEGQQRHLFERSATAWQVFVDNETKLLELTLGQRGDGLADRLAPGAITRLYEERERQLREHLHNLKFMRPPTR